MVKKIILFTFLHSIILNAQTVRITGKHKENTSLICSTYRSEVHAQIIYHASDIKTSGDIAKLKFELYKELDKGKENEFAKDSKWEVRLGMTTNKSYTKSATNYSFLSEPILYDGDVILLSDRKTIEVNLNSPFTYDKSKNLIVDIYQKSAGNSSSTNKLKGFKKSNSYNAEKHGIYSGHKVTSFANRTSLVPQLTLELVQNKPYEVTGLIKTQVNVGKKINIGTKKMELISLNVKVEGNQNSKKNISSLNYNLKGTTNTKDISNLRLFYNKTNNLEQASEITTANFNKNTISKINKDLESGDNYFFIVADVIDDGNASGRKLDMDITDVVISNKKFNEKSKPAITGNTLGDINIFITPIIVKDDGIICGLSTQSSAKVADYGEHPSAPDYVNSWSALVFSPKELGSTPKKITKIGFYVDCKYKAYNYPTAQNQKVYMKLLDRNPIEDDNIEHPNQSCLNGYTEVYSGNVNWIAPKTASPSIIKLQKEFHYDGKKNLIIYYKNNHGKQLDKGFNPSPTFTYASSKFPQKAKRSIGGKSSLEGHIMLDNIKTGWLPVTYFEYKPNNKSVSGKPQITNLSLKPSICELKPYKLSYCELEASNYNTVKWTKSANANGTIKNSNYINATYIPTEKDYGKTITLTIELSNDNGKIAKSFDFKIYKKPVSKIKRIK